MNSDPYVAASWNRTYEYQRGVFGSHLWIEFKRVFKHLATSDKYKIEYRCDMLT